MFIQGWYSFFIQSLAVRLEKQQITDASYSQVMENINKFVLSTAMNKGRRRLTLCITIVQCLLFGFNRMISINYNYIAQLRTTIISHSLNTAKWSLNPDTAWLISCIDLFAFFLSCRWYRDQEIQKKFLELFRSFKSFILCLLQFKEIVF